MAAHLAHYLDHGIVPILIDVVLNTHWPESGRGLDSSARQKPYQLRQSLRR
jgi:hypothetical protein